MSEELDLSLYTRAPVIDVPSGYALGVALLSALPKEVPAGSPARAAARRLRSSLVTLSDSWRAREKLGPADRRPFDVVADASWRALAQRLEAAAHLSGSPAHEEIATEARALYGRVFVSGLSFTQLPYASQWAHAEQLLKDIDAEGLTRRIDAIAGEPYLAFVRRSHVAYGEALRITASAGDEEVGGGVREPLRRVQVAMQEYVFALLGTLPPSKPANVTTLRRAFAPIDAHRASLTRNRAPGAPTPTEPVTPDPIVLPPVLDPAGPAPVGPIPDVG